MLSPTHINRERVGAGPAACQEWFDARNQLDELSIIY